jgi:hypothetical protein
MATYQVQVQCQSTLSSLPCQIVPFLRDDIALGVAAASRVNENWVLLVDASTDERNSAQREAAARPGNSCNLVRWERSFLQLRSSSAPRHGEGEGK